MEQTKERVWIRRDRDTGELSEVTEKLVREKIRCYYLDQRTVISEATVTMPLTTGFADYWPKRASQL